MPELTRSQIAYNPDTRVFALTTTEVINGELIEHTEMFTAPDPCFNVMGLDCAELAEYSKGA